MGYQGPYQRHLQYTKGSVKTGDRSIDRGTVDETRFGSEYFSGANVGIYFGDTLAEEVFGLEFNLQEQVIPIYGYGSYVYDAVAKGQRTISGSFNVFFKKAGYLALLMDRLEEEIGFDNNTGNLNSFRQMSRQEETTVERIIDEFKGKGEVDFNQIAQSLEQTVWGDDEEQVGYDQQDENAGSYFTPLRHRGLNSKGFDILISYGPIARNQAKDLGSLTPRSTIQQINGVHLTGVNTIIDPSGQPIYEQYSFIARDINKDTSRVKSKSTVVEDVMPVIRLGRSGKAVESLQLALNRFISWVLEFDDEINKDYISKYELSVDGHYGPKSKATVKLFQQYYDLTVDGIVGKQTWGRLRYEKFVREEF